MLLWGAAAPQPPARLVIDYPLEGSVFPPDMEAPAFVWRETEEGATAWQAEVRFADGGTLTAAVEGERLKVGEIDARCVGPTNRLPELTEEEAAARTWKPQAEFWEQVRRRAR